jgi:hypothetical protein
MYIPWFSTSLQEPSQKQSLCAAESSVEHRTANLTRAKDCPDQHLSSVDTYKKQKMKCDSGRIRTCAAEAI